jgi:hypothetical protein
VNKEHDPLGFNSTCILAAASDMADDFRDQSRRSAHSIARILQAVLRAHSVRPWGRQWGGGLGFTDAINDLIVVGLFKIGPLEEMPIALSMLNGNWELF